METILTQKGHSFLNSTHQLREHINELQDGKAKIDRSINSSLLEIRDLAYDMTEELVIPVLLKSGETVLARFGDRWGNEWKIYDITGRATERVITKNQVESFVDAEHHFFDNNGEVKNT